MQVVRKILEHFSTYEFLPLTLINKEWNFVAKSLMKTRGNIVAKIGHFNRTPWHTPLPVAFQATNRPQDPAISNSPAVRKNRNACEDLVKFVTVVQSMSTVVLITCLDINVISNHDGACTQLDKAAAGALRNKVALQDLKILIWSKRTSEKMMMMTTMKMNRNIATSCQHSRQFSNSIM